MCLPLSGRGGESRPVVLGGLVEPPFSAGVGGMLHPIHRGGTALRGCGVWELWGLVGHRSIFPGLGLVVAGGLAFYFGLLGGPIWLARSEVHMCGDSW